MTVTLGLLINPVAGIGGLAGMGGSDGADVQRRATARGGVSHAARRADIVLRRLAPLLLPGAGSPGVRDGRVAGNGHAAGEGRDDVVLLVAPGPMGETTAAATGVPHRVVPVPLGDPTSAADTVRCAAAFAAAGVDLLLFAGGDGTATDVARGCGALVPVLGIPSGVKMYSGCFAVNPAAAATIAARVASGGTVGTTTVEVVDLDEDALRGGTVRPRLTAALRIPVASTVQSGKAPTTTNLADQVAGLARAAAEMLADGVPTALGPGGSTRAVLDRLGLPATLLGVDIVCGEELLAADVDERELRRWASLGPLRIMVSVIGGQGFLFGRGNQQFSPRVLRAVGRDALVILAPEGKLAALRGQPLLVDTGDPDTDRWLAGYRRILTGPAQWAVYPVGGPTG